MLHKLIKKFIHKGLNYLLLEPIIMNIFEGSTILSDGWRGYCGIDKKGFKVATITQDGTSSFENFHFSIWSSIIPKSMCQGRIPIYILR